jgi:hypothetical protein
MSWERDGLEQGRRALDARLGTGAPGKRENLEEVLRAAGLITVFKTPPPDALSEHRLINVDGKPLSETLIEERR